MIVTDAPTTFTEKLALAYYTEGYLAGTGHGRARAAGADRECYERGLDAGMVARWCGVSLLSREATCR